MPTSTETTNLRLTSLQAEPSKVNAAARPGSDGIARNVEEHRGGDARGCARDPLAHGPMLALLEVRVLVAVRRGATAEEAKRRVGANLVPGTGRDQDGVARTNTSATAVDLHLAGAFEHEVDLLGSTVVVPLRLLLRRELGLRETLIPRGRHPVVEQDTDRAAVSGRERLGGVTRSRVHFRTLDNRWLDLNDQHSGEG
jgi:hypothetical protein